MESEEVVPAIGGWPLAIGDKQLGANSQELTTNSADRASLLLRIEEFIDEYYQVRVNVLSGQYEVTARGAQQWMVLNGTLCNRILMELNHAGIILAKPYIVKTVIEGGAMVEQYHPVRCYLKALPA